VRLLRRDVAAQVGFVESQVWKRFVIFQVQALKPGAVIKGSILGQPAPPYRGHNLGMRRAPVVRLVPAPLAVAAQVETEGNV
jgi:phosphoenolpyruvate carboxylase